MLARCAPGSPAPHHAARAPATPGPPAMHHAGAPSPAPGRLRQCQPDTAQQQRSTQEHRPDQCNRSPVHLYVPPLLHTLHTLLLLHILHSSLPSGFIPVGFFTPQLLRSTSALAPRARSVRAGRSGRATALPARHYWPRTRRACSYSAWLISPAA
ncbi:MAG: hypothetical protein C4289_07925 [Chloroflexota bacterium]